jgi:subtilase family serine protease
LSSGAVFEDAASIDVGTLTVSVDYLITATVDTNHQIAESNEANNGFRQTYVVVPLPPLA